jgi:hypothetical protein
MPMLIGNVLLIGWNRPVAGREQDAVELFGAATNFYEAQKKAGKLSSFEHVLLTPHGGDLNGFTLLRGEPSRLSELLRSDEWMAIEARAIIVTEGFGVIHGTTGEGVGPFMALYTSKLPKR